MIRFSHAANSWQRKDYLGWHNISPVMAKNIMEVHQPVKIWHECTLSLN